MNRKHEAHSTARRLVGGLLAALAITTIILPADSPAAHAEACANGGLPQRVLLSVDLIWNDVQSCLDNEWVLTMRIQRGEGTRYVVNTPEEPKWQIDSRAFFDLSSYNPVAAITQYKEALASGTLLDINEKVAWKIKLANVKAQVLVMRSGRPANEKCKSRSRPYSLYQRTVGGYWSGPVSVLPASEPSTITYAFDPSMSEAAKAVVLNAIAQYTPAVDSQDAAFQYPSRIVPHESTDSRAPTITFKEVAGLKDRNGVPASGLTKPDFGIFDPPPHQWKSGSIELSGDPVQLTPAVVGHEIGHVLGLDHMFDNVQSTMDGEGTDLALTGPWSVHQSEDPRQSVAFDECMFLPAN